MLLRAIKKLKKHYKNQLLNEFFAASGREAEHENGTEQRKNHGLAWRGLLARPDGQTDQPTGGAHGLALRNG
jgi:hypothetical protein